MRICKIARQKWHKIVEIQLGYSTKMNSSICFVHNFENRFIKFQKTLEFAPNKSSKRVSEVFWQNSGTTLKGDFVSFYANDCAE